MTDIWGGGGSGGPWGAIGVWGWGFRLQTEPPTHKMSLEDQFEILCINPLRKKLSRGHGCGITCSVGFVSAY